MPVDLTIEGDLIVNGTLPSYPRASLTQDDFAVYPLPFEMFRVWDAYATVLPGTSATDDLGLYAGAFATGCPYIATSDLKAAGATTRYARTTFCLPAEYVSGQSVRIRVSGGMITTAADVSATVDFEVYKMARDSLKSGSDLCSTAATTINSTTFANKTFDITSTGLAAGDWLDIRMTIAVNDAATATAVIGAVGAAEIQLDIKG